MNLQHSVFGELAYDAPRQQWAGWVRLPLFAECDGAAIAEAARAAVRRLWAESGQEWVEPAPPEATESQRRFARGEFPLAIELPESRASGWAAIRAWWRRRRRPPEPAPPQEAAFRYLVENEADVLEAVLKNTLALYRGEWSDWRQFEQGLHPQELDLVLPQLDSPKGLQKLVRLTEVNLLGYDCSGVAPIRFLFDCSWDDEHGHEVFALRDRAFFEEPTPSLP